MPTTRKSEQARAPQTTNPTSGDRVEPLGALRWVREEVPPEPDRVRRLSVGRVKEGDDVQPA